MSTAVLMPEPSGDPPSKISAPDFEAMSLSQDYATGATKKTITEIPIRKPGPTWWFMVHPDESLHYRSKFYEVKEDGELYTVAPELRDEFGESLVMKVLLPAVTRGGTLFLWPIRLPDDTGRIDSWNRSAMNAAKTAMLSWTRIESSKEAGGYRITAPTVPASGPEWPNLSRNEMLKIAFTHFHIGDRNHPRLRARKEVQ